MTVRVGTVPYLVAQPLTSGLEEEPGITIVTDAPSRLVEGLRAGTLDVALASSIEIFRRDGYRILPGLGIAADGEVWSVRLFSRRPFPAVRTVALDGASRSAAALVRILLAAWTPHRIEYREVPPGTDAAALPADAFLRIGDEALRREAEEGCEEHDLARAWKEMTGLPIVFALWVVRPGADLAGAEKAIARAAKRGLRARAAIAGRAAVELGLPEEKVRRYLLEVCRYDLREAGVADGLIEFRNRASAVGLCRDDLRPRSYRPAASPRKNLSPSGA